jgi:hypothetical protein
MAIGGGGQKGTSENLENLSGKKKFPFCCTQSVRYGNSLRAEVR